MNLSILDIVFLGIIGFCAIKGLIKGMIVEIFSLAALALGLICAFLFTDRFVGYISQSLGEASWNQPLTFVIIFLVVYLVIRIIEKVLSDSIQGSIFDRLDNMLGLVAGFAKGVIYCIIIVILLYIQPLFDYEMFFEGSSITPLLLRILPTSPELMPEYLLSATGNV